MRNELRLPLVGAFFAFLAGILVGLRVAAISPGIALAALPLLAAPLLHARLIGEPLRRTTRERLVLVALLLAGAGDAAQARRDAALDCRSRLADGAPLVLHGVLAAEFAAPADTTERIPLLPLHISRAVTRSGPAARCRVEARVRLPRGVRQLAAGSGLRLSGEWRRLPAPVDPGHWPAPPAFVGYLLAREAVVEQPPSLLRHPLLTLRGHSERQLRRLFPRNAALADALVLGRRETMDRGLADAFSAAGLTHLLAISGTHVALVGAVLVLLGRVARLPLGLTAWLTILLICLYLAMIGAPPSAVRSGIMTGLALLTLVLQRPSAPLAIMAAAALLILALQPLAALDAGFQLSFAGVLGIVVLRRPLLERVPEGWREGALRRALAESLVVSVAAFAATAPVVAHHFGQVAPVSIAANLPAIPLSSLALVGIGAACVVEPVSPAAARLLADGASLALDGLQWVVRAAAAVPGGHAAVARPRWWLWAAAALAMLLVLDLSRGMRPRVRWALGAGSLSAAWLLLPLAAAPARGLELAFLDVGQGDALAIHTPADHWLLVDTGPRDDDFDAGERRVLPWLRAHGAQRLEAVVLTHPHSDHIGGAAAVLRGMRVERLLEPGMRFASPVYEELLETAEERQVPWNAARQGRVLRVDGVELRFVWPTPEALDAPMDANDISAVVQLRYGRFSALLAGDAPDFVEHALVARYGDGLHAEVLKAGHHGSRTASSAEFLQTVHPSLMVISCGRRNQYGHPAPETLERLRALGIRFARTDEDGTVLVEVSRGGAGWARDEP